MLGRVKRTCCYSLEHLSAPATAASRHLVGLSRLQEEQEPSLGLRAGVPSVVKRIAVDALGVQRGPCVSPYFTFLRGGAGSGVLNTTWSHADKSDSKGLCHQRGAGEPVASVPNPPHPSLSGLSACQVPPRVGVAVMLRDSRGRGRGGSVAAVAGGSSPAAEARGEAPHPEADPHRIKRQTHSVPRSRSGRSPLPRSCSDAPERPWASRTGGTSCGLAARRWIGARTTTPSCLPSLSSTTRCGTREREGRRAEGESCLRGCGAWKQAAGDRGCPRQESLHAPFSGRCFQRYFCTPLRSLSRTSGFLQLFLSFFF